MCIRNKSLWKTHILKRMHTLENTSGSPPLLCASKSRPQSLECPESIEGGPISMLFYTGEYVTVIGE